MSNRRKTDQDKRAKKLFRAHRLKNGEMSSPTLIKESALDKVTVPKADKIVAKTVPAKAYGEVIGTAVIYTDGTVDIVVKDGISEEAKESVYGLKQAMLGLDDNEMKEYSMTGVIPEDPPPTFKEN